MTAWPRHSDGRASSPGLTEYRRPQLLDAACHKRGGFDSGEPSLDEWLKRSSGQSRRGDTAATWVIVDSDQVIIAYASLSMTAIDLSRAPASVAKGSPHPVPALLLGRLAVDKFHAGIGLGTELVKHVLATAVELNHKAACKIVVVTALNANSRRWWEHLGFHSLNPNDPDALDLYLRTVDIEATLEHLA